MAERLNLDIAETLSLFAAVRGAAAAPDPVAAVADVTGQRKDSARRSLERLEGHGFLTVEPLALTERGEGFEAVLSGRSLPAAAGASSVQSIPIGLIHRSPLNPRRRFDAAQLDELAASLKAKGQLQPGLVRPHPDRPGHYEIAAGERRWRAAQSAGLETYDAAIRPMTDAELVETALVENDQRADVTPMEQAEGLARRLDLWKQDGGDEGDYAAHIARVIGRSEKLVRARLRLVRDLVTDIRDALFEGRITLAQAEALCRWPEARQPDALKNVLRGAHNWRTRDDILARLNDAGVREKIALFTREEYGGFPVAHEAVDDGTEESGEGQLLYMDRARAERLQREKVEAQVAALQAAGKWAFVELCERDSWNDPFGWGNGLEKCKAGDDGAGKLVWLRADTLKVSEYICRRAVKRGAEKQGKGRPAKDAATGILPAAPLTNACWRAAGAARTAALRAAMGASANNVRVAMALVVMQALDLGATMTLNLAPGAPPGDGRALMAGEETWTALAAIDPALDFEKLEWANAAGNFALLLGHPRLEDIFAAAVAAQMASWPGYAAGPGDDPVTVAAARALDLEAAAPPADHVRLYGVAQLEAVAFDIGAETYEAVRQAKGKAGKAAALQLAIEHHGYVPRELRFGTPDEIGKSVDAMLDAPARAAKKKKAKPKKPATALFAEAAE